MTTSCRTPTTCTNHIGSSLDATFCSRNDRSTISRDHSIRTIEAGNGLDFPVHSLIGGKWTTFRAFSEQAGKKALNHLGKAHKVDTKHMPIGGGKGYPQSDSVRRMWLETVRDNTEVELEQLELLFDRYGTYVVQVAAYIGAGNDAPMEHIPQFTRREIAFLVENEKVVHLDDFMMRRSLVAMLGYATEDAVLEIADVMAETLSWSDDDTQAQIERAMKLLHDKHRYDVVKA